jgi:uncharacterized Zn-finger protein
MRYHQQSQTIEHENIDVEHHLIHLRVFIDIMAEKFVKCEYQAASVDMLYRCLMKLDQTGKNYLHKKLFVQIMSSMEDAFDVHECEELTNFFVEHPMLTSVNMSDAFDYKRYVKHLLPKQHRIYLDLADRQ